MATGVARRARFDFELGIFALQIGQPVAVMAIPEQAVRFGQSDMQTSRTVTGLATHVDFTEVGLVAGGLDIEIFL